MSPPSLAQLSADVTGAYGILADLDPDERTVAAARGQDRPLALRLLAEPPDGRPADVGLH